MKSLAMIKGQVAEFMARMLEKLHEEIMNSILIHF